MGKLVGIFVALCFISALAPAQSGKPRFILLHPGAQPPNTEGIVIPSGSPLRLASFTRESEINVAFHGRFTLSGTYEVEGYGKDASAILRPDRKSRTGLPYWRDRGGPEAIYILNGWAFAQAVVPKDKLQKLKAEKLPSVRGQVTIIADDYRTSIECDVANFSARFVSVVKVMGSAAKPTNEGDC